MLSVTRERHEAYCHRVGADYIIGEGLPKPSRHDGRDRHPIWRKTELVYEHLLNYQQVWWYDADCVIVTKDFNVFDATHFGIACCECRHHTIMHHLQCGAILFNNDPRHEVYHFVGGWNDYPSDTPWHDQMAFNWLMGAQYRDFLTILPNRFNCCIDYMPARPPIYVQGFHGFDDRINVMRKFMETL